MRGTNTIYIEKKLIYITILLVIMKKKCRKCKQELNLDQFPPMNIWKYWVWSTCFKCLWENKKYYEIKRTPLKPSIIKINKVSKNNKNTIAKFSQKTKDEIKARDKVCIISGEKIEEYHHVYFWANANRWKNRNDADQWVWLSSEVHRIIHHPSPKETQLSKIYRAKCIIYVKQIIKKL